MRSRAEPRKQAQLLFATAKLMAIRQPNFKSQNVLARKREGIYLHSQKGEKVISRWYGMARYKTKSIHVAQTRYLASGE